MEELEFYYNFGETNSKKVMMEFELSDYEDFSKKLEQFRIAQQERDLKAVQPVVNVWIKNGNINRVSRISAAYNLKKGLFSKKIKTDEFYIGVEITPRIEGSKSEYVWITQNYEALNSIFYEFIVNRITPDLTDKCWTRFSLSGYDG